MEGNRISKGPVETAYHCKLCEGGVVGERAVMGSELHCISPMLFFVFTLFTHGLSNSAVLHMVPAGE